MAATARKKTDTQNNTAAAPASQMDAKTMTLVTSACNAAIESKGLPAVIKKLSLIDHFREISTQYFKQNFEFIDSDLPEDEILFILIYVAASLVKKKLTGLFALLDSFQKNKDLICWEIKAGVLTICYKLTQEIPDLKGRKAQCKKELLDFYPNIFSQYPNFDKMSAKTLIEHTIGSALKALNVTGLGKIATQWLEQANNSGCTSVKVAAAQNNPHTQFTLAENLALEKTATPAKLMESYRNFMHSGESGYHPESKFVIGLLIIKNFARRKLIPADQTIVKDQLNTIAEILIKDAEINKILEKRFPDLQSLETVKYFFINTAWSEAPASEALHQFINQHKTPKQFNDLQEQIDDIARKRTIFELEKETVKRRTAELAEESKKLDNQLKQITARENALKIAEEAAEKNQKTLIARQHAVVKKEHDQSALQKKLDLQSKTTQALADSFAAREGKLQENEQKYRELKKETDNQLNLVKQTKSNNDKKETRLNTERKKLESQKTENQTTIDEANRKITSLETELTEKSAALAQKEEAIKKKEQNNEKLSNENRGLQRAITALKNKEAAANKLKKQNKRTIAEARTLIAKLTAKKASFNAKVTTLANQIAQQKAQQIELRKTLETQLVAGQTEIKSSTQKIVSFFALLKSKNTQLMKEKIDANDQLKKLTQQGAQLPKEHSELTILQKNNTQLHKEIKSLQAKLRRNNATVPAAVATAASPIVPMPSAVGPGFCPPFLAHPALQTQPAPMMFTSSAQHYRQPPSAAPATYTGYNSRPF